MTLKNDYIVRLQEHKAKIEEDKKELDLALASFVRINAEHEVGEHVVCNRSNSGMQTIGAVESMKGSISEKGVMIGYVLREVKKDGSVGSIECYYHQMVRKDS